MTGSIHNTKDSHPQCVCGRKFRSMGAMIEHWSVPCEGDWVLEEAKEQQ